MKSCLLLIALLLLIGGEVLATDQEADVLVVRGRVLYTHDMPDLKEVFPNLDIPEFGMTSTANWKGYTASWAVIRDQLYLIGLQGRIRETGETQWDEKILEGEEFPVKIEGWSGGAKQLIAVYVGIDPDTGKSGDFDEVSTVTFENGKVTNVVFDAEVPKKAAPQKAE